MAGGRSRRAVAAAATILVLFAAAGLAACGHKGGAAAAQTATQRFAAILGHQPTGLAATIAARDTLVVGEDPEFAPQSTVDSAGTWSGFDVDVAREVASVLGLKTVEIRQLDWARVPAALTAGSVRRRHQLDDDRPEAVAQACLRRAVFVLDRPGRGAFRRSDRHVARRAQRQDDRRQRGDHVPALPRSGERRHRHAVRQRRRRLTDVGSGRLAGALTADTTIKSEQAGGAHIAVSSAGFYYQPQAFATRQGETDLVAVLSAAVKTMRANGSLSALSRKWYDGLNVSAAPAAAVPSFSQALAMLKAGTYPAQ